jgi:hypothetical protein
MSYPPAPNKVRYEPIKYRGSLTGFRNDGTIFFHVDGSTNRYSLWEEAYSESHPGWQHLKGSNVDKGGPFYVFRNKVVTPPASAVWVYEDRVSRDMYLAIGNFMPINSDNGDLMEFPPMIMSDEYQMNMMGAEAVAKAAPGTAPTDMGVALGELRKDGLPKLPGISMMQQQTSAAKKAGDEYLNAQFGWAPVARDAKSLVDTVVNFDRIQSQMERDSGKRVRRKLTLKEEDDTVITKLSNYSIASCGPITSSVFDLMSEGGPLYRAERKYRKVWFSGAFTYYLPKDYYSSDVVKRTAARAKVYYGISLTPNLVWNLAPWSWAVDWFSNAGEVISNAQRFLTEGLVMHHGYLMEHTIHEYTYYIDSGRGYRVPTLTLQTETKGRVKANPFGFGVEFSMLNGFQTSILVALGMSRSG